ncbi:MAG: TIGR02466 family protein [Acetobacteraceae bacterium]
MREMRQARFGSLFATPMLEHMWADASALNPPLREAILRHAAQHPGSAQTNVGGWHSETGLLEFCGSAGEILVRHMREMTEEATRRLYASFDRPPERLDWSLSAWANVNRTGHYNTMHTHPGATWSGVYYVDDGNSDADAEPTAIELTDPNPARTAGFFPELSNTNILFPPVPGLMILFPSYVPHAVPPHRGDRPRISIAFNVRKEPFP